MTRYTHTGTAFALRTRALDAHTQPGRIGGERGYREDDLFEKYCPPLCWWYRYKGPTTTTRFSKCWDTSVAMKLSAAAEVLKGKQNWIRSIYREAPLSMENRAVPIERWWWWWSSHTHTLSLGNTITSPATPSTRLRPLGVSCLAGWAQPVGCIAIASL